MGKYLRLFLQRLPEQTIFDRLEVVLDHNDPSAEEIGWVRDFQKQYPGRLKHLLIEPVDPIGVSMNRCIHESSADNLAIWNVDDLRTPDSLEQQAALLARGQSDIAYGDFQRVRSFGATKGDWLRHAGFSESELTRSMILGPFFMFRKELCKKAGFFDEQLRSGADFDLAIRLAMHGRASRTEASLGYYLNEELGASTRPGSLQPVERTVIELRYGIYDKIDYRLTAKAARYNIPNVLYQDQWLPIRQFVPDYDHLLDQRYNQWHRKGMGRFIRRALIETVPFRNTARRLKQRAAKWVSR